MAKKRKPASAPKRKKKPDEKAANRPFTIYVLWQVNVITKASLELADHIDVVGDKKSTLDKIDVLREAIVYMTNQIRDLPESAKKTELHDLLKTVLEQILPYYQCTKSKPDLPKNALKLRQLAEKMKAFIELNGGCAGDWPIERLTDEIRTLAGDLKHYNSISTEAGGRASSLSWLVCELWGELYDKRNELTDDELKAKEYLFAIRAALLMVSDIGYKRRDQQPTEKLRKIADSLEHFANRLDENPIVAKYRQFWQRFKQEDWTKTEGSDKNEQNDREPSNAAEFKDRLGAKTPEVEHNEKMSRPLFPKKWASIFNVSTSTIRRWKKDGTYPFQKISERKWALPINKLPAEYLQKYEAVAKS